MILSYLIIQHRPANAGLSLSLCSLSFTNPWRSSPPSARSSPAAHPSHSLCGLANIGTIPSYGVVLRSRQTPLNYVVFVCDAINIYLLPCNVILRDAERRASSDAQWKQKYVAHLNSLGFCCGSLGWYWCEAHFKKGCWFSAEMDSVL